MFFLYNILITLLAVVGLPWFLVKLITTPKYREGAAQRLGFLPSPLLQPIEGSKPIWVHAVSVGETIAAAPLIRKLRRQYPARKIVLSTVTATGNLTARAQVPDADAVIFFPFDLPGILHRVVRSINPALFILIETEIWPNCIRLLHKRKVPILVVNGRISQGSYRGYRRIRFMMKRVLPRINGFLMQTEEDAQRIVALGAPPDRVQNAGNIKFDRDVLPLAEMEQLAIRRDYFLPEEGPILIAGSTHSGEEAALIGTYLQLRHAHPDLVFILAPRHPERAPEVEALLQAMELTYQKRSRPQSGRAVLLLDTVGELMRLYGIGTVAFVGGSLVPSGGHNILEPAIYGVPVVFGPHMENFPEITEVMVAHLAGLQVKSADALAAVVGELLRNDARRQAMGDAGMAVIRNNQGALETNLALVGELLME